MIQQEVLDHFVNDCTCKDNEDQEMKNSESQLIENQAEMEVTNTQYQHSMSLRRY